MTTATVTYHELPSWSGSSDQRQPENPQLNVVRQNSYPVNSYVEAEEEIKWSHLMQQHSPYQQHQLSNDQLGPKKPRHVRSRVPVHLPSEELCLVCGDKASGYHYNALTCEGCKGFFRRSITRKAVYQCKYGHSCDIDMYMRRKCQHCRLEKCSRIGMRAELVIPEEQCRIKREAKLRQRTATRDFLSTSRDSDDGTLSPQTSVKENELSSETSELISRLTSIGLQFAQPSEEALTAMSIQSPESRGSVFQNLAELIILEAQLVHEFVRSLPGFMRLREEDKKVIQKACKTDVLLLRSTQRFDSRNDCLVYGNENYIYKFSEQEYSAAGAQFARSTFDFVRSLKKIGPDSTELVLLSAIVAFSDRPGLSNPREVEEIQEVYTAALQQYIECNRTRQRAFFAKLLVKLTDLKSINIPQSSSSPISPLDFESFVDVKPNIITELRPPPTQSTAYFPAFLI